ncbi:MAG TPA: hypothetical protein VE871_20010 [Longimicrobium sp.]|nr:hypothetical protein [Longimicrobium sp.]
MTTTLTNHRYGALAKRAFQPRPRTPRRNDHEYVFSNPVNAARLRQALENSLTGRNLIPFTMEELRKELGLERT